MLYHISAPHFYAGAVIENGFCVDAAPIIRWMVSKSRGEIEAYCARKGWKISSPIAVLACGGRDYTDYARIRRVLDQIHSRRGISKLIHGAARGADTLSGQYANESGIWVEEFPADWNRYGNRAGSVRNQHMLNEGKPDLVVAFPGGRGTADMIRRSREAGVPVFVVPNNP